MLKVIIVCMAPTDRYVPRDIYCKKYSFIFATASWLVTSLVKYVMSIMFVRLGASLDV